MDMSQYITLFLEESKENLQRLNERLLLLENQPEDIATINEIFRVAHTLKGMSATMGFNQMADLTHKMENVLDLFRNGVLIASSEVITILFECLDTLSNMVESIGEGKEENYNIEYLVNKLESIATKKEDKDVLVAEEEEDEILHAELNEYEWTVVENAQQKGFSTFNISVNLSKDCLIKSARAYLVIKNLEEHGDIIKSIPSIEEIEEENFDFVFELLYITQKSSSDVKEMINKVSEIESVEVKKIKAKKEEKEKIQNSPEKVVEEVAKEESKSEDKSSNHFSNKPKLNQSVRVDLNRLDNFMNLVSELVIHRTRLEQLSSAHKLTDLHETLEQVARITTDLQDLVLKIRMLPIEQVFNRFPRMVRDLSKELGKEIELIIEGKETELDRTVIDEMGDPMVHLIRNAVDHGIESKEERVKAGKNPRGTVKMIAYQEGNKAVILVEDDGKGIDPEIIKKKAIEKGIQVEGLNEEALINLVFHQGFSTNEEVTDISGRGVGMDVVKRKISLLGGSVEVKSQIGKGTTFIIHLPLTLSIIQALLVKVESQTFAIPLGFIEKVVSIEGQDIKQTHNEEVFIYREEAIPVVKVNQKLNLSSETEGEHYMIIVKKGQKIFGLLVDGLVGQQEIVIKTLGKSLEKAKEYVGATILGDGLVTLILDVSAMI